MLVNGLCRGRITELYQTEPYLEGNIQAVPETEVADSPRNHALCREATSLYAAYMELAEYPAQTVHLKMLSSFDPGFLADCIGQNSGFDFTDKARLLCNMNPVRRLERAMRLLRREIEMLNLEADKQAKTHASIDRNQKDYYLRE